MPNGTHSSDQSRLASPGTTAPAVETMQRFSFLSLSLSLMNDGSPDRQRRRRAPRRAEALVSRELPTPPSVCGTGTGGQTDARLESAVRERHVGKWNAETRVDAERSGAERNAKSKSASAPSQCSRVLTEFQEQRLSTATVDTRFSFTLLKRTFSADKETDRQADKSIRRRKRIIIQYCTALVSGEECRRNIITFT